MELKYKSYDEYIASFCEFCGILVGPYLYQRRYICKVCWNEKHYSEYWNEEGSIKLLHIREQNESKGYSFFGNDVYRDETV